MLLTKEEFISVLDELRALIEADDSMEGRLNYEWAADSKLEVYCFLRTGNSQGQGGAIMIQPTQQ